MARETVLVTGASAGIGRDLARCFAADGSDLVLVARRAEALESLSRELEERFGTRCEVVAMDLTDPSAPERLHRILEERGIRVDVLVNNAGFGALGPLLNLPLDRQLDMIQLNVSTLTALSGIFLPGMVERGRGGILNVGSTAAFQAGPLMAVYYATKAYVQSFTEALAEEVRDTGVTVSVLAPGPTESEFADRADMNETRLFRGGAMSSAAVAMAGHEGFRKGQVIIVPGLKNRLGIFSNRLFPRSLIRKVVRKIQES